MHRSLIRAAAPAAILTASILSTPVAGVAAGFLETDLVANQKQLRDSNGVVHTPKFVDPNLLNPWGVGESTTSPFWVSDNNNGTSTLYNTAGMPFPLPPSSPLVVSIPLPGDPLKPVGTPTGLVSVSTQLQMAGAFKIGLTKVPAHFLFATEDGTIVGWAAGTHGIIAVDNSNMPVVREGSSLQRARHRHRYRRNDLALRHEFPRRYSGDV
jgi:hypothetical protein